jgi:hypothetical protein
MAVSAELILWNISGLSKGRIEELTGMAFGDDQPVTVLPVWISGVMSHAIEEEGGDEIG